MQIVADNADNLHNADDNDGISVHLPDPERAAEGDRGFAAQLRAAEVPDALFAADGRGAELQAVQQRLPPRPHERRGQDAQQGVPLTAQPSPDQLPRRNHRVQGPQPARQQHHPHPGLQPLRRILHRHQQIQQPRKVPLFSVHG